MHYRSGFATGVMIVLICVGVGSICAPFIAYYKLKKELRKKKELFYVCLVAIALNQAIILCCWHFFYSIF